MAIMCILSTSPTTVVGELAGDSDYQLPYFSPNEQSIIVEWVGDDENNLAPPNGYNRLLRILWRQFGEKTQPPPGTPISFETRLYSFGFAKHNGSIYHNPLAEMALFLMIKQLMNDDPTSTQEMRNSISNKMQQSWFKFMEYLNLSD